jgi:hypothetical protein
MLTRFKQIRTFTDGHCQKYGTKPALKNTGKRKQNSLKNI